MTAASKTGEKIRPRKTPPGESPEWRSTSSLYANRLLGARRRAETLPVKVLPPDQGLQCCWSPARTCKTSSPIVVSRL